MQLLSRCPTHISYSEHHLRLQVGQLFYISKPFTRFFGRRHQQLMQTNLTLSDILICEVLKRCCLSLARYMYCIVSEHAEVYAYEHAYICAYIHTCMHVHNALAYRTIATGMLLIGGMLYKIEHVFETCNFILSLAHLP